MQQLGIEPVILGVTENRAEFLIVETIVVKDFGAESGELLFGSGGIERGTIGSGETGGGKNGDEEKNEPDEST
jgi:hypothetical protein